MQEHHSIRIDETVAAQLDADAGQAHQGHALPVQVASIPEWLRIRPHWVLWGRDGTYGTEYYKAPVQARTGRAASSTNADTWVSFADAVAAYQRGKWAGVGIVLTDGLIGVDIDDCIGTDGELSPLAREIIGDGDTYTELSPSGTGIKLLTLAPVDSKGGKLAGLEIYTSGRYFTITGHVLHHGTPTAGGAFARALGALARLKAPVQALPQRVIPSMFRRSEGASAPDADERRKRYAERAAADELRNVATAGDGTRNDTLNAVAYRLGRFVADGALDGHQVQAELLAAATSAGLGAREAEKTIGSGLGKGMLAGAPNYPDFTAPVPNTTAYAPRATGAPGAGAPVVLDMAFVARCLALGERGDAELFTALVRGEWLYEQNEGAWYAYSGHIWQRRLQEPRGVASARLGAAYLALAAQARREQELEQADAGDIDALAAQAGKMTELKAREAAARKRATELTTARRINAVLTFARETELLGVQDAPWDAIPGAICVANGVLDLATGTLRDGTPGDMLRTQAPTEWRGIDAPAPRWGAFVREILDGQADVAAFVHRLLGYSLSGTLREHIFVIMAGARGRNGKGELYRVLQHVLGPYARAVHTDVIVSGEGQRTSGSAEPHKTELRGVRLALASETDEGKRIAPGQIKTLSGGDTITARNLYERPVTFAPTHTIFLATNPLPIVPANDDALWRRLILLNFRLSFVDPSEMRGTPDERPVDKDLGGKLKAEAPGILAALVRGYQDYQRDGLNVPDSVRAARDAYRLSEGLDAYLAERVNVRPGATVMASSLYQDYVTWCTAHQVKPKSATAFGKLMGALPYTKTRTSDGNRYEGIALRPASEPAQDTKTDEKPTENVGYVYSGIVSKTFSHIPPHEGKDTEMYTYHTYPTPLSPESAPNGTPGVAGDTVTVDGVMFVRSATPGVFDEVWIAIAGHGTHQLRATLTKLGTWYASANGAPAVPSASLDEALSYLALLATV